MIHQMIPKTLDGQIIHQADLQKAIFFLTDQESAIFYNNREYKDCTIYAFKLTEEKHRAIAEIMGGEAELELAGTTYHLPP